MRNRIFGAIGAIWGALILYNGLSSPVAGAAAAGSSAYESGKAIAIVFGVALVVVGIYYFFKKPK